MGWDGRGERWAEVGWAKGRDGEGGQKCVYVMDRSGSVWPGRRDKAGARG